MNKFNLSSNFKSISLKSVPVEKNTEFSLRNLMELVQFYFQDLQLKLEQFFVKAKDPISWVAPVASLILGYFIYMVNTFKIELFHDDMVLIVCFLIVYVFVMNGKELSDENKLSSPSTNFLKSLRKQAKNKILVSSFFVEGFRSYLDGIFQAELASNLENPTCEIKFMKNHIQFISSFYKKNFKKAFLKEEILSVLLEQYKSEQEKLSFMRSVINDSISERILALKEKLNKKNISLKGNASKKITNNIISKLNNVNKIMDKSVYVLKRVKKSKIKSSDSKKKKNLKK